MRSKWRENQETYKKDYVETKAKLECMYKQITKGAIVRSRVKWYEDVETNSKYFMGLEKQKCVKNSIVELKSKTGRKITEIDEILIELLQRSIQIESN